MAKLDTPVRKEALEVVDEYPSLRGIEKVVNHGRMHEINASIWFKVIPREYGETFIHVHFLRALRVSGERLISFW
jgi:hypothetical protein